MCQITEQRLADQARAIRVNQWLSEVEIEEIRRNIMEETNSQSEENLPLETRGESIGTGAMGAGVEDNNPKNDSFDYEDGYQFDATAGEMREQGCSDDKITILRIILDELDSSEVNKPPNLRSVDRSRLKKAVREVNVVVGFIQTRSITETNRVLIVAANVVALRLGFKRSSSSPREPWWKRRIKGKIKQLRKDISRLERVTSGETRRRKVIEDIAKRYPVHKEKFECAS